MKLLTKIKEIVLFIPRWIVNITCLILIQFFINEQLEKTQTGRYLQKPITLKEVYEARKHRLHSKLKTGGKQK